MVELEVEAVEMIVLAVEDWASRDLRSMREPDEVRWAQDEPAATGARSADVSTAVVREDFLKMAGFGEEVSDKIIEKE